MIRSRPRTRRIPVPVSTVSALVGCIWLLGGVANAHPLAPSLLELREGDGGVTEVLWKTSLYQPVGSRLEPVLPEL